MPDVAAAVENSVDRDGFCVDVERDRYASLKPNNAQTEPDIVSRMSSLSSQFEPATEGFNALYVADRSERARVGGDMVVKRFEIVESFRR